MSDSAKSPIIELNNVYLKSDRGGHVFKDLCFDLPADRSAVISGPAGSGKSLLVQLLIGQREADSGSVELFGQPVNRRKTFKLDRLRRKIGGVGGVFGLIPSMTVQENILFPMVVQAQSKRIQRDRLRKVLTEFSLLKQAQEYPHALTRVESSLVQFARASIANQPLMIIDEPTAGLDRETFKRMFDFLVRTALSGRSMLILTSENQLETLPNTDNYRIQNGSLV